MYTNSKILVTYASRFGATAGALDIDQIPSWAETLYRMLRLEGGQLNV
jgi:hypothetical protein